MKIGIFHQTSTYEVSVCLRGSTSTMGSRSGISNVREGDDVSQVLWEVLWPSVCVSEVLVRWLRASMVREGRQVEGQQRVDVVQEGWFPTTHP